MTLRFTATVPAGMNVPPAPIRPSHREKDAQVAEAIELLGVALVDLTPAATREALRQRLQELARARYGERKPVLTLTLERIAKTLER